MVQEEDKTPERLDGIRYKHCDRLSAGNYTTETANSYPESGSEDTLVTCADDALIPDAGHPKATDDGKELIEARHPDLSKDADLPLRRMEEVKLLGHFCSVALNRLRDCESRIEPSRLLA